MRKLLVIVSLGWLTLVLIVGAAVILVLSTSGNDAENSFILPQDCNGTNIHLSGTVQGGSADIISVKGENSLHGGSGAIDLTLTTDANGDFDSGSAGLPVFVCEILSITVSAEGFETQRINYVLLDHFSEAALCRSIKSGQALPVHLDIELQPAK